MCRPVFASVLSVTLLAALHALPTVAESPGPGDGPSPIDGTISVVNDHLTLDADISQHIAQVLGPKLGDGLSHRVQIEIVLLTYDAEGHATLLSFSHRACRLLYDLWGERYAVRVEANGRQTERWSESVGGAAKICGAIGSVILAPLGKLDLRRRFRVALRVQIDPRRSRLDAGRPTFGDPLAAGGVGRPGGTFFGAMARAFYREDPDDAARGARFESPIFGEKLIREALGTGLDALPAPSPPEAGGAASPPRADAPPPKTPPASPDSTPSEDEEE